MDDTKLDESRADRLSLNLDASTNDLNLKQLYYFHAVATEGSIARAAKKLGLAQPTISEQLKNLESYLDQVLFERKPNGLRLNQHGRRVFEHTTVMFRSVRRMLQEIAPERTVDRWVLELGVCPSISRTFTVDRFLPLFELDEVTLRIRHGMYQDLMEDLLTGEIDLVISENQPTDAEREKLGERVLSESRLVFVASPELCEKVVSFPSDLGGLPTLSYPQGSRYRWEVDRFFVEQGIAPDVLGEADDAGLMATAAAKGLCFVAVPESAVGSLVQAGELQILGPVDGASARVYAHFGSVKTPDAVIRAVEMLTS